MADDRRARDDGRIGGCLPLFGLLFVVGGAALAAYTWRLSRGSGAAGNDDIVFRGVMSAVIAGIGITLAVLGRASERAAKDARRLVAQHPDRPWLWREDWIGGRVKAESTHPVVMLGAVSAVLLLLSAPLMLKVHQELIVRRNYLALAGLVFPAAGLLVAGQWVVSRLRRARFAGLRLRLDGVPAALGGRLSGQIEGEFQLPPGTRVNLVLSCVRSYVSGKGSDGSRWQRVLWQDARSATALVGGSAITSIPVEFTVPYDARETNSQNPDDEILWRVTAGADVPGLDFRCVFVVPVFKTGASDPRLTIAALEAESVARREGNKPEDSAIVSGLGDAGGLRFHLPAARHKVAAATMSVFGILSLGSGLFFGYGLGKALWWGIGLIPAVVFGGLGLLILAISFGLWFGATTVEVIRGELHTRLTYLVFSRSRILRREDIRALELHDTMQRGDQVWYDLRVRLANGRETTVGGGMEKSEAEWFLAEIKREMGL